MKKWIILDRDGVINIDSDAYIKTPDEWHPIPGSLDAIAKLNWAGYHVLVASNQSAIGKGLLTEKNLELIQQKMENELIHAGGHLDGFFFCPHNQEDNCQCRKPKPGLFTAIETQLQISLKNVPAVGDSLRDIQAAKSAGCQPILVRTGKGQKTLKDNPNHPDLADVPVFENLADAVSHLLSSEKS
jgi:D-glycero-D-manno-heptose 1,7-bisphosphate phosphatase